MRLHLEVNITMASFTCEEEEEGEEEEEERVTRVQGNHKSSRERRNRGFKRVHAREAIHGE
jgi:hypothetical protein